MKKRILSLVLILALATSVFAGNVSAAKKKVVLSKKTVSLEMGKSVKLKLKNNKKKVKWTTDKKKVVKLSKKSKKGVTIKALKEGKAKVTAKIGKKKYICKVTVTKKGTQGTSVPQETAATSASLIPAIQIPTPNPATQNPGQQNPGQQNPGQQNPGQQNPGESATPSEEMVTVSGTVKDAEGELLGGIEVYVGKNDDEGSFIKQYEAKTTEQGTYTFSGLQKNSWYDVRIGQIGKNTVRINTGDEKTYHLKVEKSMIKVNGVFQDTDGKPLNKVHIGLYDSEESLKSEWNTEGSFETDSEGKFNIWAEKNRVYYVRVSGLGEIYFPGTIDTSRQNQILQIEDSVVSVSGVLKNEDGTVRKNETLYLYNENDSTWHSKTITTGENGEYTFSMSPNFSYRVNIRISVASYWIGTIVAGDESTYDVSLDFKISDISGSLRYANGKMVDSLNLAASRYEDSNTPEFNIEIKEGKYNIQLRAGDTYYLKTKVGSKTYSAGILTAGEESTYDLKLDVSLQTIEGMLLSSNGTKIEKERISFYDNPEYSGNYYQLAETDESGKYKTILEEDTVYYARVSLTGQTYEIANIKTEDGSHDLKIESSLEKVSPVIKDPEGKEFAYWYLYEDREGELGKLFYSSSALDFNTKKRLYLESGKKIHIKVARGDVFGRKTSADFYAGVLTAGNSDSYHFQIATSKVTGKVTDAFGNIVSSGNITKEKGYWGGMLPDDCYRIMVKLTDKEDGTSISVENSSDTFSTELLEGRHYDVSLMINRKDYPVGELVVGDESTYDFQVKDIVKVDGTVRDGDNQLVKEKKLYFWEGENVNMRYGEPQGYATYCGIDANGKYGLYLEAGKTYSIMAQMCDEVNNREYVSIGSITTTAEGKNTCDLKCSEIEIKGNLTDASGKAVQNVWVRFYENENDSDYNSKVTKHPDAWGEFSVWLEKKTYYVRVQKVSGGKYTPIGKLTVGEDNTYHLVFNEEEETEGN